MGRIGRMNLKDKQAIVYDYNNLPIVVLLNKDVEKAIIEDFKDLDLVINSIKNNDYDKGGILNILKCHKRNKLRNFGDWKK